MDLLVNILIGVIIAATPLVFAAIGELVVEKSGVLNLGVEGMMIMGAIAAFATTIETGSFIAGIAAAIVCGALMALLFAVLTQTLLANQVATGLALTMFGLGLAALIGQSYSGKSLPTFPKLAIPGLSDLPVLGPAPFWARCLGLPVIRACSRSRMVPDAHANRPHHPRHWREP